MSGYDVADNEIVKSLSVGDLVITNDIPLAYEVIGKGGQAINPRGERYTRYYQGTFEYARFNGYVTR
jgi:uncharacterized protein YaiI (UPF0178 family)